MDYLYIAFLISILLFLWNHTNFFVEYCELLGLDYLFKIGDYINYNENGEESGLGFGSSSSEPTSIGYLEYLLLKHDCFFVRLITCPICLAVWLNIFSFFIHESLQIFSINLWLSMFLYFIMKLVMKKSDE